MMSSTFYCLYVERRMFVARGLVSQPKWQRWSNHWYVLVGSKSSSGGRGLLWYPKHVVSAADTSQPSVQHIDFLIQIHFSNFFPGPQKSFREVLRAPGSPNKDLLRSYEQVWVKSSESAENTVMEMFLLWGTRLWYSRRLIKNLLFANTSNPVLRPKPRNRAQGK